MKRLVILVDVISPYRVPVFSHLAEMSDLTVITLARRDRLRDWEEARVGFPVEVLPSLPFSQRLLAGDRPVHLVRKVRTTLRRLQPHTVVIGGWNQLAFWSALRRPRPWRSVLWVESTAQDARPDSRLLTRVKRLAVRSAEAFVVPGSASHNYLRDLGATGPIHIAPNAVDVELIQRHSGNRAASDALRTQLGIKHLLLFVGRPEFKKGIDIALDVLGRLGPDVGLVVLGDSSEIALWKERVSSQGLHRRIVFEGFVSAERVAALMGGADVFLFPSRTDSWGLVLNEAQAAGCPIVTSSAPGAVVDLSVSGAALVLDLDPEEWSRQVASLLENPKRRREMATKGLEISARYSPSACAAGLASTLVSEVDPGW